LDIPRDDFNEIISISYNLSLFSSKASSGHGVGTGATPGESSSVSRADL
jgi:hypothetical protein